MKIRQIIIGLVAMAMVPFAAAQSQGSLGSTSTATTDVTITLNNLVQVGIEGALALTYDAANPDDDITASTGVCVFRRGGGDVSLSISSDTGDGDSTFVMRSGGNTLSYSVDFEGGSVDSATPVSGVTASTSRLCRSGGTPTFPLSLSATVTATDANAAATGSYSDTVVVVASPI